MIKLVVNIRETKNGSPFITVIFFNEITINLKYDSIASTYKFQMYFDPNDSAQAELACVSHIHECKIYYVHPVAGRYATHERNGVPVFEQTTDELIITGFMLSQLFSDGAKPSFMEIGGYSKPGTLGDCDFPTSAPLQSIGLSFRQIVQNNVIPYFSNPASGGFNFHIKSSRADSAFEDTNTKTESKEVKAMITAAGKTADEDLVKSTANESKNILSYLKDLAIQKNLILSTDIFGNLIVNVPYTGDDFLFEIGTGTSKAIKFVHITCNYNGQALHSQIEVKRQADKNGGNEAYAIVLNSLVPIVFRPKVVTMTSGDDTDAMKRAISERGTELKNIPLKITLDTPVVNGKFIMPNHTIKVKHRQAYLYTPSKWFIEEVLYTKNADGEEQCELTCVLPSVYDSSEPINVFVPAGQDLPDVTKQ